MDLQKNPLLATELERVENHERINAIDSTRFSLPPPPNPETATVEDWEVALRNARAQLEHQQLRYVRSDPSRLHEGLIEGLTGTPMARCYSSTVRMLGRCIITGWR